MIDALLDARSLIWDKLTDLVLDAKYKDESLMGLHPLVRVYSYIDRRLHEYLTQPLISPRPKKVSLVLAALLLATGAAAQDRPEILASSAPQLDLLGHYYVPAEDLSRVAVRGNWAIVPGRNRTVEEWLALAATAQDLDVRMSISLVEAGQSRDAWLESLWHFRPVLDALSAARALHSVYVADELTALLAPTHTPEALAAAAAELQWRVDKVSALGYDSIVVENSGWVAAGWTTRPAGVTWYGADCYSPDPVARCLPTLLAHPEVNLLVAQAYSGGDLSWPAPDPMAYYQVATAAKNVRGLAWWLWPSFCAPGWGCFVGSADDPWLLQQQRVVAEVSGVRLRRMKLRGE